MASVPRYAPLAVALLAACGGSSSHPTPPLPPTVGGAIRVSSGSPFPSGCNGAPQPGVAYRGAEVEPWLAVDPGNPLRLVGVWQQDRWSNGGANADLAAVSHDGGLTWTRSQATFTRCSGGNAATGGDYERASDPWVAISSDGTVHQVALAFDKTTSRSAILASRSTDGGLTWSDPATLRADVSADVANDKESVTTDPTDALRVYATWDRLAGLSGPAPEISGPAWLARSLDGGLSWEPARAIYDPGLDAQTVGNVIAVLPDGTLVDVFTRGLNQSTSGATTQVVIIRSVDHGATWSAPVVVSASTSVGVADPKNGDPVRAGDIVPAVAVDPVSGVLWVAWSEAAFSGGARDGIALSRSSDGGLHWSAPVQANQVPAVQAFTPALAVASDGTLGLAYLDFREDSPADPTHLWTTAWLASTGDGGATWREAPLGARFDLRAAPRSEGWFLGDYLGLVARGATFASFFVMTNAGVGGNQSDVFAGSVDPAAGVAAPPRRAAAAEQRVAPRPLQERLRALREARGGQAP